MLSIPQPVENASQAHSTDSSRGKPVVELAETSEVLDRLLRLCYPVRDPALQTPAAIQPVLRAALKYEMEGATAAMRERLSAFVDSEPLEVWATACSLGLEEEARQAAKILLKRPIPEEKRELPGPFRDVTAGAYFRFVKFHRAQGHVPRTFKFCEPNPGDGKRRVGSMKLCYSTAPPQFTERPFADLICRAADGTEFRTHKIVLAASSPSLRQRILKLDAGGQSKGSRTLPVLALDSRSEDLEPILELLYPGNLSAYTKANALHLPPGRLLALAECARMYELSFVDDAILRQWRKTVTYEPMLAFLLATRLGCKKHRQVALNALQKEPRCIDQWSPEMEAMPASAYHEVRLLRWGWPDSDDELSDLDEDMYVSDDDVLILRPRKRRAP